MKRVRPFVRHLGNSVTKHIVVTYKIAAAVIQNGILNKTYYLCCMNIGI